MGHDPLTQVFIVNLPCCLGNQTCTKRCLVAQEKCVHAFITLQNKAQDFLCSLDVFVLTRRLPQEIQEENWVAKQEVKLILFCATEAVKVGLSIRKFGHQFTCTACHSQQKVLVQIRLFVNEQRDAFSYLLCPGNICTPRVMLMNEQMWNLLRQKEWKQVLIRKTYMLVSKFSEMCL